MFIPVYSHKYKLWRVFRYETVEANNYEELDSLVSVCDFYEFKESISYANKKNEKEN